MNPNTIQGIAISIIAALLFEAMKKIFSYFCEFRASKARAFSYDGYWISSISPEEQYGTVYDGKEILKIKTNNGQVFVNLYLVTSDKRKYVHIGRGFIRGDKLMFVYQQKTKSFSNQIGMCSFKACNLLEHSVILNGNYFEYRRNKKFVNRYPYTLYPIDMCFVDKLLAVCFGKRYIWKLISKGKYLKTLEKHKKIQQKCKALEKNVKNVEHVAEEK